MNGTLLSTVIVTYNCYEYLEKCIKSIYKYNDIGSQLEIIVVDNGTDESYQKIKGKYNDVISFKNDNRGFGDGNNKGALVASGKYILFLNPDTEFVMPVFKFAINVFENNPNIGCFGVRLIDTYGKHGPSYNIRFRFGLMDELFSKICIKLGIFLPEKMYTSGADLFFDRDSFFEVGMFDSNIFMYFEETDVCERLNSIGKKVAFYPELKIIHHEGKTQNCNVSEVYLKTEKSKKYVCNKFGIDYFKLSKKESRYCSFKMLIFKLLHNERYEEYKKISKHWNEFYNQLN